MSECKHTLKRPTKPGWYIIRMRRSPEIKRVVEVVWLESLGELRINPHRGDFITKLDPLAEYDDFDFFPIDGPGKGP